MINNILDNIDAVIFDMDGTLIDSMWLWRQIDIDYFARFNLELPDTLQHEIEGMSFLQTAEYMKKKFGFTDSVDEMMNAWNEMAYELYSNVVDFKPGVLDFIKGCKKRNIKLGIATSNSRYLFDAASNHLLLDKYFDCMLTGSEITNGKPAPDVYLTVAKRLNVDTNRCLVFEDIIAGIMAGKNAGMKVCAVYDEYSKSTTDEKIRTADYYITDYTELEF